MHKVPDIWAFLRARHERFRERATYSTAFSSGSSTLALTPDCQLGRLAFRREARTGGKILSHGRAVTFQMPEVVVDRQTFEKILRLISRTVAEPAARASMTTDGRALKKIRPEERAHASKK